MPSQLLIKFVDGKTGSSTDDTEPKTWSQSLAESDGEEVTLGGSQLIPPPPPNHAILYVLYKEDCS